MFNKMCRVLLLTLSLVLTVIGLHRPGYIIPCSKSHKFNECAIDHAKKAIPHLLNGDRRLGIQPMNPMEITSVKVDGVNNFKFDLKDVEIYGLESVEPLAVEVDFDKNTAHLVSIVPRLVIVGEYKMTGKLMFFSLNGNGPFNVTLLNGMYKYDLEWTFENKRGEQYAKIVNSSYDYELQDVIYNFTNLINDNEELSKEINSLLNENWRIVNEDLKGSILETLLVIHNDIFHKIFSKIPFRELFLD